MEFEGQYLEYSEYQALGGTLDQMSFNLLEFSCRAKLDKETQMRLVNESEIPERVKLCIFNMMNVLESYASSTNGERNKQSESIDGYSVSFVTGSQVTELVKAKNVELDDIIQSQLYGVIINGEHLIYRGVNDN